MKKIINILLTLFMITLISCSDNSNIIQNQETDRIKASANDSTIVKLSNVLVLDNKLKFDLECKLISSTPFIMGSSTFAFNKTFLSNPILSNVNPKYTIGNGNGYYQMMVGDYGDQIVIQIIYLNPPGNYMINNFERIATITTNIDGAYSLNWNNNLSYIINPQYIRANVIFNEHLK